MIKSIFIILFITLLGCKNIGKTGKYNLTIELQIDYDDNIQLFYTDHPLKKFSQEKSVLRNTRGSDEYQKLQFKFNKISTLAKIRIDLGDKINKIDILSILISNGENNILIEKENIPQYFKTNEHIELSTNGDLKLKYTVNKNYDPYITSTPFLIKELLNL